MAGGTGFSVLTGIGEAIHAEREQQLAQQRQDKLRKDDDTRARFNDALAYHKEIMNNPTSLPESKEASAKEYARMIAQGPDQYKGADLENGFMAPVNAARQVRLNQRRQQLGLKAALPAANANASQGAEDSAAQQPSPSAPGTTPSGPPTSGTITSPSMGMPGGLESGGISDMLNMVMQAGKEQTAPGGPMSQSIPQDVQDSTSPDGSDLPPVSSDPRYSPAEQMDNYRKLYDQNSGANGSTGSVPGPTIGGIGPNGQVKFKPPATPKYVQREQSYTMPDGTSHRGAVSFEQGDPQGFVIDPVSHRHIPVTSLANARMDTITAVQHVDPTTGKKVVSYESSNNLEGQTFESAVPNKMVIRSDSDGNIHLKTFQPGFGGRPDTFTGQDDIVGKNPMTELNKESARTRIALGQAMLLNPHEADYMINEEEAGHDMSKVPGHIYVQMLQRRSDLGMPLPDRYTTGAQKTIADSMKVLSSIQEVRPSLEAAMKDSQLNNIPYTTALNNWAYTHGFGADPQAAGAELERHISSLSLLGLNSAGSVSHASRAWPFIEKTLIHTPKPGTDSRQLMMDKLKAIELLQNETIEAQKNAGLKGGGVRFPGSQPTTTPGRKQANSAMDSLFDDAGLK